ncbi:CHAT domain-containing protein [Streptomyces griseus]
MGTDRRTARRPYGPAHLVPAHRGERRGRPARRHPRGQRDHRATRRRRRRKRRRRRRLRRRRRWTGGRGGVRRPAPRRRSGRGGPDGGRTRSALRRGDTGGPQAADGPRTAAPRRRPAGRVAHPGQGPAPALAARRTALSAGRALLRRWPHDRRRLDRRHRRRPRSAPPRHRPRTPALLAELATADVVHLAVHGTMDQDAPWLHCLYLTPDEDDDGRLFAHDFLELDLSGVRLVTLAACESALGRFDRADNVRGVPAALLTAGVQAVVGCLWAVRPEPATYFFQHLHRRAGLADAPEQAFRAAQTATRARYPAYRDWGAFTYLLGRSEGATA